jgi:hypothetical protein
MKIEELPEWTAVVISVIALVISLLERRASERRAERAEFRQLLDNFLLRLEAIFGRTRKRAEYLMKDMQDLHFLEYPPSVMRSFYEPLSDTRKLYWQVEIRQLQRDDQEAVHLISRCAHQTLVDPKFRKACEKFVEHATRWIDRWNFRL